jgi:hypothetical protein
MGLEVLVPLVMGALLKVAGKAAGGVLDAVHDASHDGANALFAKIKSWWAPDHAASDDLDKFQGEPDVYAPVIQMRLIQKFGDDPSAVAEFEALLEQAGPQVKVFQDIATANGVTGATVTEMQGGTVSVEQKINSATNVTGAQIGRMG